MIELMMMNVLFYLNTSLILRKHNLQLFKVILTLVAT